MNTHSKAIRTMAGIMVVLGIIASIFLSFLDPKSFNVNILLISLVTTIISSFPLWAMAHIAAAIEDTHTQQINQINTTIPPQSVKCPNCQSNNNTYDSFCKDCGSKLK